MGGWCGIVFVRVAEVYGFPRLRKGRGLGGAGVVGCEGGFRAAVVWVWSIGVIGGGEVGARTVWEVWGKTCVDEKRGVLPYVLNGRGVCRDSGED